MSKRVSVRDVACLAEVSIGTVSNYLNDSAPVSPATQVRIQSAIDQLGYKRNEIARSLRRSRTKTLGVLVPNIANPFYTNLYDGIESEARRRGYTVTLGITHHDDAELQKYLDVFAGKQLDGLIIDAYVSFNAITDIDELDIPIVVIEPSPKLDCWSSVKIDNAAAGRKAVEYLIGQGHRQIAMIAYPPTEEDMRYLGYCQALDAHDIPLDANLVIEADVALPNLVQHGAEVMEALLARASFTACFIYADILAVGALAAIKARGLRIPDDVAVIGFDDIPLASYTDPPLTTIYQPQYEMGKIAVDILLQQLKRKDNTTPICKIVESQLVIRGST